MADQTNIEWSDSTFNPWIGCTKVSPACDNCYAEAWAQRFNDVAWGAPGQGAGDRRRTSAANWKKPEKWNDEHEAFFAEHGRRRRVFCASLSDVFDNHRGITSGWHGDVWALIDRTPNLDWLLLTKRPQNIGKMLPETYGMPAWEEGWNNVWLGTTVENQKQADKRIPALLEVPAKVRFLSMEPLLEEVDISNWLWPLQACADCPCPDPLTDDSRKEDCCQSPEILPPAIDWIIAGGESGENARSMQPGWIKALQWHCEQAEVPFLFKQWGEFAPDENGHMHRVGKKKAGRMLNGQTFDGFPVL